MTIKVLIAYASKNGSTEELARTVARTLDKEGFVTDLRPAADVLDTEMYDAVVLGSALYTGRWLKDARRFAARHRTALAARPVWLFSSGPLDATANERDIPLVAGVRRIQARIDDRGHATFGGCLTADAEGRMARMIVDSGKGGDFRDFAATAAWAREIAADLYRLLVVARED
ncbi:flavodoxin domain-containing protein [Streptomyces sp. NBC_00237]|uniref:flavodoxin domain-containing protein n=1 Tax=Streptomyces sp. NBC_00237 TaxID=2975687 RepID=UPI00225BBF89|nr:flavodoxin domain-containing protein [Streptomyces sp. NBC_00237]MCX5205618.1 flavodoxin domain-containing protein [Streptomyces sp. NBC_00237]